MGDVESAMGPQGAGREAGLAEQLRRERERLFAILRQLPAKVYLLDEYWRVVFTNTELELPDSDADDVDWDDLTCYRLLGGRNSPCPDCRVQEVFATGEGRNWQHPDHRGRYFEVHTYPFGDVDGLDLVMHVTFDVTDQRRDAARHSILFDHLAQGVVYCDGDGVIVAANPAALRILDADLDELIGSHLAEIAADAVDADGSPLSPDEFAGLRALRTARPSESQVIGVGGAPENGHRWLRVHAVPMLETDGAVRQTIVTLDDITETRHLERRVQQNRRMEAVGRLAGGVAHDFNNLLSAIRGYADLVLDGWDTGDAAVEDVAEIKKAAERAAELTGQLLAFSRRQPLRPRHVDVNESIRVLEGLLSRTIREDIDLRFELEEGLWPVEVDPVRLDQVLMNLIVNAQDALPSGGQVRVSTSSTYISPRVAQMHDVEPGSFVRLVVQDDGVGMDEQTMARIFEPFYTTKQEGGTGLGLATVYGIVTQSGGHVTVTSRPGEGAEFEVLLPVVRANPLAPSTDGDGPGSESNAAGRTASARDGEQSQAAEEADARTVLLVEDEAVVRRLAARVLKRAGFTVIEASSGKEALRLVSGGEDVAFDVLVTDVVLPGIRGPELAETLQRFRSDIPVVFMSGYTDDAWGGDVRLDADTRFLQKPFGPDELLELVRAAVDSAEPAPRHN